MEIVYLVHLLKYHLMDLILDNLSEGSSNLYYTDTRVKTKLDTEGVISGSSQVSLSGFSTSDLSEGTNFPLYYTDTRVKNKIRYWRCN